VNVLIDENLSPALASALNALFAGTHEVRHMREKFGPGVTDVQWIETLSKEGRWIIISGDRRITRNKAEYYAFRGSRLVGSFLSKGLCKAKVIKQMECLLAHWERIEQQSELVEGGAMFEVPMTSTRLRQIQIR
jgi:hypothetical protein